MTQTPGWTGPVRMPDLWDQLQPGVQVTFNKIIIARHFSKDTGLREEASAALSALREKFVQRHGEIQNAYYCSNLIGGCALTEKVEGNGRRPVARRYLHTVLNRATPELAALEATCNALTVKANAVLGARPSVVNDLRVVTDAVYSAMTRVLRAADEAAAGRGSPELEEAATAEVAQAETAVREAVQREGNFTYFQGVLGGALVTLALCALLGVVSARYWSAAVSTPGFVAAVVFGALGAVTSVFQRISADRVVLTFTPSRLRLLSLGALRPVVGAVFGAVVYSGLVGGIVGPAATAAGPAAVFGLSAVTGFAAGFSERFATDVVKRVETGVPPA